MNVEDKINTVKNILKDKKVAVGFSGGADSTLIAYLSSKVAKDTLAVTIDNHLMPTGFTEHTKHMAELFGIKHVIIDIDFYSYPDFLENGPDRCYNCRNLMYSEIEKVAFENGFDFICDGNNISDLVIDRPGILITYSKNFQTPLIEARLNSGEIHEYLEKNNIEYSKSTTCLATRIPSGTRTTREKISRIRCCEDYITSNTCCKIVKVRDYDKFCICEVDDISEITCNNKYKQINDELNSKGFKKVSLNLSEIEDNDEIKLDFKDGSFSYQLPYTVNIENTKNELEGIKFSDENEIQTERITITNAGTVKGKQFENYEDALNEFMATLTKIRRNI